MSNIRWDSSKSEKLKIERGVSFEEILQARFVTVIGHPHLPHQRLLLFEYNDYLWAVPYVKNNDEMFLKTLFPSRKYTRMWKRGELG